MTGNAYMPHLSFGPGLKRGFQCAARLGYLIQFIK